MSKKNNPTKKTSLILFDLDGTLLDSHKRISDRNMEAIAECRRHDIIIGVATARNEATCSRFTDIIKPELVISNSGALVRVNGRVIYQRGFTAVETAALIGAGLAQRRGITVDCADVTFSNRHIPFFNEPGMEYTDFSGFSLDSFKVCIEGTETEFAKRTAALVENCSWLAFSDCEWFKFSKAGVSKGDALRHVVKHTGIPTEEMIAFGDDFLDIEMLDICGTGIAMSNSPEEVKLHAAITIGNNDSDAIADFLYSCVL